MHRKNVIKNISTVFTMLVILSSVEQTLALGTDFYVGADIVNTLVSGERSAADVTFQKGQEFKDDDVGYGIHVGYQINDWLATELSYTDFGSTTDTFKIAPNVVFIGAPMDTQTIDAQGVTFAAVFSYPIAERFSALATIGVTTLHVDSTMSGGYSEVFGPLSTTHSFTEEGLMYGIGAKYALSESFRIRADLRRNDISELQLDSFSAGVEFGF